MNIDKIIAKEITYNYLDRVEAALNEKGLTFSDLKSYKRVGSSQLGEADASFKSIFGNDTKIPNYKPTCLCGHRITQQCYLCPEGSNSPDDILILGNHCIKKWGYEAAIRGKGVKVKCECCGATVNKSGIKRHQKTQKCRNSRDTASNVSTSVGSDE